MNCNLGQREYLLEILNKQYTIPDEFQECVKVAIRKYATNSKYNDDTINSMLSKPQSVSASLSAMRDNNLSLFRGRFAEWLVCIEYNALKNKGNVVMTIINPDPTSKADLLHIIKIGEHYEVIPGPDIKCGGSTYVFNQWKKIVNSRYDIPMVDMDDILTTEDGLKMLTEKQRIEFDQLKQKFPKKKPTKSVWSKQDINRLMMDYLKYVSDGTTPINSDENLFVSNKENIEKIKNKIFNPSERVVQQSDWSEFNKRSFELTNIQEKYLSSMSLATLEKQRNSKVTQHIAKKISEESSNVDKNHETNLSVFENPAFIWAKNTIRDIGKTFIIELAFTLIDRSDEIVDILFDKSSSRNSALFRRSYRQLETNSVKSSNTNSSSEKNVAIDNSKTTHESPTEHLVREHGQHYNTRDGRILKQKSQYKRGKND